MASGSPQNRAIRSAALLLLLLLLLLPPSLLLRPNHPNHHVQVQRTFLQIAADLSGVELTRGDMVARTEVIPAQIVNHPQHDPRILRGNVPDYTKDNCCIT